jgi:8-oxo-dGTP diphosphatase
MPADATLYLSQKAFVRRGADVLVLHDPDAGLDFPGGKLQDGETDLALALRREVREETGLEIEVGPPFVVWLDTAHRMTIRTGKAVLLVGYACRCEAGEVRLSDEHDGFRWIGAADPAELDDGSSYFAALARFFARG